MHGLGWVVLWTTPVFAQPAPEDAEIPPQEPSALEAPVVVRPTPVHDTHSWYDAVPTDASTRVFMNLSAVGTRGLAVDGGGGVWRTEDGTRWRLVLEPLAHVSGPGDLSPPPLGTRTGDNSLDYRALELADELESDRDGEDFDYDYDGADSYGSGDLDSSAAEDTASDDDEAVGGDGDATQAELTQALALDGLLQDAQAAGLREGTMRLGGAAWLHPDLPDLALAGRADGLWRSLDGGSDWHRVDPLASATVFASGPGELLLVGSADGLKYSVDRGRTWIDKDDPMDGQRVRDVIAGSDGTWWCATDAGLYTSADAEYWDAVPLEGLRVPDVRALLVEPGGTGSLILTDNETVYRSDDQGQTVTVLGRQPLLDTTRMLALPGAGHVIASGSDGVWETVDGGLSWRPVASGLTDPQVFDMALVDGKLHVATLNGLLRLAEGRPAVADSDAPDKTAEGAPLSLPPPLQDIVVATTNRTGVDPAIYTLTSTRWAKVLPAVQLYGRVNWGQRLDTDFSSPPTSQDWDRNVTVFMELGWGGLSSGGDVDVVVVDDVVFVDIGDLSGGLPVMAASSSRHMVAYRYALIGLVSELYLSRQQLVENADHIPPDDLRAQVLHDLQIQEVTARLDGYTDGAFTRGTVTSETP